MSSIFTIFADPDPDDEQMEPVRTAPGAAPSSPAPAPSDPIQDWQRAVDRLQRLAGFGRAAAIREVATKRPELHRAYLEAFTRQQRRERD